MFAYSLFSCIHSILFGKIDIHRLPYHQTEINLELPFEVLFENIIVGGTQNEIPKRCYDLLTPLSVKEQKAILDLIEKAMDYKKAQKRENSIMDEPFLVCSKIYFLLSNEIRGINLS